MGKRRIFSPAQKAQIVLEIISGEKSLAQASQDYEIKDSVLQRSWKSQKQSTTCLTTLKSER